MALIEVKDLVKTYQEEGGSVGTQALAGVSFSIEKGEFVAVMGPSGSGKSTLLHVLGFLDRQTSGTYRFDGRSSDEYTGDELAAVRNEKMGFVFQSFNLLPRASVLENVQLPFLYSGVSDREWEKRATTAIERVGLSPRLRFPTSQLSGGERQRVAIARALVLNPQIIFADEPTGNLDSKSGETVIEILQRLNEEEGHTVVLITHETHTAEHAERILHIIDGALDRDVKVAQRRKIGDALLK